MSGYLFVAPLDIVFPKSPELFLYGKVSDELLPVFEKIRKAQVCMFFGALFFGCFLNFNDYWRV